MTRSKHTLPTNAAAPALQKTREPAIKWAQQDIDLIVEWFCRRDEDGIPANYEAYATSAYTEVAEKMLQETGLIDKALTTKKKAADKMDSMVKAYKDMRMKAEGSGWGTDAATHKENYLATAHGTTVNDYILKKCPWFYEFEDVYHDHPGVNPPIIIESGQPPRRDGKAVDETDLGGFGAEKNTEVVENAEDVEKAEDLRNMEGARTAEEDLEDHDTRTRQDTVQLSDSDSQHSAKSLAAARMRTVEATKTSIVKTILPPLSDNEDYSWLDEVIPKPKNKPQPQQPKTPVPYRRSKTAPIESIEQVPAEAIEQPHKRKTTTSSEVRSKSKRPLPAEDSDSEVEIEKSRRSRWKSTKGKLSMAESLFELARMDDSRQRDHVKAEREERRQQFELEKQQRDQHHAAEMARSERHHAAEMARLQVLINESVERANESKERLLRLQLELQKQQIPQQHGHGLYDTSDGNFDIGTNDGFQLN